MADEKAYQHTFKVFGYIWRGDDQPITISGVWDQHPDQPMYLQSPQITEGFRKQAAERGISIGELVDEVNATIPTPKPDVTWKFDALSKEQLDYTLRLFGLDGGNG